MNKKTEPGAQLHVVLVCIPEALHGTLQSTLDVLRTAAMFAHFQHPDDPVRFTWEALCWDGANVSLPGLSTDRFCQNRHVTTPGERTLYVIPGLHVYNSPRIGEILDAHIEAQLRIRRHAEAGGWLAATHTGIGFPAKLGLLDGARIGAPWTHDSWFARNFPKCDFSASEPFVRHGRIFTSVAPGLQVEFTLAVLAAMGYPDLASSSAQVLLYQGRREKLIHDLIEKKWTTKTADSPVYRAIEWLNRHIEQPYSLSTLAVASATSERTLLRHFQQVTGMTPLEYLHDLRVERAKMLLEVTLQTVHTIAQACGYSDVASFRKIFRAVTGTTPSEYRSRFALRTRRRYWRVEALAGATPNPEDSSNPDASTP